MGDEEGLEASAVPARAVANRLASIDSSYQALAMVEEIVEKARKELYETVRALRRNAESPEQLEELYEHARYLYWTRPDLPAGELAEAFGYANAGKMRHEIGSWPSGQPCARCGAELLRTSRSKDPGHHPAEFPDGICDGCWEAVQRERSEWRAREDQERAAHFAREPINGPRRWEHALCRLVSDFTPRAIEEADRPDLWAAYELACEIRDGFGRGEGVNVGLGAAEQMLAAAREVADKNHDAAAKVVREEVGAYTPSDLFEVLDREIRFGRQRAAASLQHRGQ